MGSVLGERGIVPGPDYSGAISGVPGRTYQTCEGL